MKIPPRRPTPQERHQPEWRCDHRLRDPQLAIDWLDACLDPEINRVTNLATRVIIGLA